MQRQPGEIESAAETGTGTRPTRGRRFPPWRGAPAIFHGLLVALMAAVALWGPAALEDPIEGRLVDWRFRARTAYWRSRDPDTDWRSRALEARRVPALPPDVVIVAVDEASITSVGSWPWPAERIAELIEKIGAGGPKAIAIDFLLHDSWAPTEDARVARALATVSGKTAAAVTFSLGPPYSGAVPARLGAVALARIEAAARLLPLEASRVLPPPRPIAEAAALGHAVYEADAAGKVRRESLYLRYGGVLIPSLAFQTARIAAGLPPEAASIRADGGVDLGGAILPADRRGRLLINYYGDEGPSEGVGPFRRYSAASVLLGATSPAEFEDAVVFIGGAADIATVDFVSTPFADNLPAVEKDAAVAANILARDFLRKAPPAANLLVVLAAGLAVPLLIRRRAVFSLLYLLGLALALVALNFALFLLGLQLALVWPLLVLLASGGTAVVWQHVAEFRAARRMRRLFSSYVTERVLEQLIADPGMAQLGGERRELTILFADIRGFTRFSEKHPSEEVVRTLNEYLEAMTEVVFRWEGTLDKFIGDTILAFWGAPLPQEDHAARALRCALELSERLDRLNAAWAAAGRTTLEIGIGITTGQVLVGNIGAEGKKMDYTVIGDQVNLCSRVEQLTKTFNARILVTASTFAQVEHVIAAGGFGHVAVEELADVAIKGKEEPVCLYRISPRRHGEPTSIGKSAATAPGA